MKKITQILKWLILIFCWLLLSAVFLILIILYWDKIMWHHFEQIPSFFIHNDGKIITAAIWKMWLWVLISMTFAGYIIYRFAKKRNKNSKTNSQ